MDSAFGWLGQLIEYFSQLVPRVTWVLPTHGAVAFTRGKHVREYGPGLAGRWWCPLWWPAWTEMYVYPTARQTHNTPGQTLTTNDDVEVTISGVVTYRISDLEKAMTAQHDLEDTIADITEVAMAQFVRSHSFEDIRNEDGSSLKVAVQKTLQRYGVGVADAGITNFARTRHITIAGSGGAVVDTEEEEE